MIFGLESWSNFEGITPGATFKPHAVTSPNEINTALILTRVNGGISH